MLGEGFIGEEFVNRIWNSGRFAKGLLRAKDGRRIEVIYQGQWNDESGADFRNAEIRIDGQNRRGDVEVHVKSSHWRSHRHDTDPRYNSTILHVALWDDGISLLTRKQNGERIPILILCDYLDSPIGKLWKIIREDAGEPRPCYAGVIAHETLCTALDRAGMDRFLSKAKAFEDRLEGSDEDQLLYEGIMEALGYSRNRQQFLDLAHRIPLEMLIGNPPEKIQAILFGVAGLLPSQRANTTEFDAETEEYVCKMELYWKPLSSQFRDRIMSKEQWEFFRIRPENFPAKRIAGISYILSGCAESGTSFLGSFLSVFNETNNTSRKLRDILMPRASGYWARHYNFGEKSHKESSFLIGRNRAADIVVNVVLPVVMAYTRQSQHGWLQQTAIKAYTTHPKLQDNKITRYVADRIFRSKEERISIVNSAMRQQGLIGLYKSFCLLRNCHNCPLMKGIV
mgnify:CR=1 FL=1